MSSGATIVHWKAFYYLQFELKEQWTSLIWGWCELIPCSRSHSHPIFSLEFNFSDLPTRIRVTCPSHDQTMIIIGWTKPRFLPIIDEVLITDSVIAWYPVRFPRLWLWWEAQRLNSSENVWKELDVNEICFHSEVNLELSSPVLPGCKWELSTQNCLLIG